VRDAERFLHLQDTLVINTRHIIKISYHENGMEIQTTTGAVLTVDLARVSKTGKEELAAIFGVAVGR
jgi:hypothetical protein